MNRIFYFLFTALLLNGCGNAQSKQGPDKLSATEFSEKIGSLKNAVIVDVRTPEEFQKGHVPNALNLNWNGSEFDAQLATLDKDRPVYVYCLSGGRSGKAVEKMRQAGFANVIEMPGGMMEWRANNLPEIKAGPSGEGMSLEQYHDLLRSDKLVLVDFYADWCAPCKKMEPYLEKIAVDMAEKVELVRINVDENAALCKQLKVVGLPVLKLFKENGAIWEHTGFVGEAKVREVLASHTK